MIKLINSIKYNRTPEIILYEILGDYLKDSVCDSRSIVTINGDVLFYYDININQIKVGNIIFDKLVERCNITSDKWCEFFNELFSGILFKRYDSNELKYYILEKVNNY